MSGKPGQPNAVDVHVGAQIRVRRRALGISQTELANRLGLTFQQVQKYERGANRVSASKLYGVAEVLGLAIGYFFDGLPDLEAPEPHDPASAQALQALLMSHGGPEMAQLFSRLTPRYRRAVLELLRSLVEAEASSRDH